MNLHQIVSGAIGTINPFVQLTIKTSTGSTTNSDRERAPSYAAPVTVTGQVQSLTDDELKQIDALNIQGVKRKIYLNGKVNGVVRPENKGGDLVILPNGDTYKVVLVFEYWPDWCSAGIVLQDGA